MKERLDELLAGRLAPGVYRLTQPISADEIAARAGRYGWRFARLEGREIRSKAAFLDACSRALAFPAYFGRNWDALADCLRDLAWAPATAGHLLLYDDARIFASVAPADCAVALAVLRAAAAYRRAMPAPLVVLLRRAGRAAALVPRL